MLKIISLLASLMASLLLVSCSFESGIGKITEPSPEIILASVVSTAANLPSCQGPTENLIFYVQDEDKLKQCRVNAYHDIDLTDKGVTLLPDGTTDGQTVAWSATLKKWIAAPLFPGATSAECSMTVKNGYMIIGLLEGGNISVTKLSSITNGQTVTAADASCVSGLVQIANESTNVFSCVTDYYDDGSNDCVAVEDGYYRVGGSQNVTVRNQCSLPTGVDSANFTSPGNGTDSCSYNVSSCSNEYYQDANSCISIPVGQYVDTSGPDPELKACEVSNPKVDQVTFTSSGNYDVNGCSYNIVSCTSGNIKNSDSSECLGHYLDVAITTAANYALKANGKVDFAGYGSEDLEQGANHVGIPRAVKMDEIPTISNAVAISGGQSHVCIMVDDSGTNKVRCVGDNNYGQIGDGSTGTTRRAFSTNTDALNLTDPSVLKSATNSNCVIDENLGSTVVKCWGRGTYGQLGQGDELDLSTPTIVPGTTGVLALYSGRHTYCAKFPDNATTLVKCWGLHMADVYTPANMLNATTMSGLAGADAIHLGDDSLCKSYFDLGVRKYDCLGNNYNYNVGVWPPLGFYSGTGDAVVLQTYMPDLDGAINIFKGSKSNHAIRSNGTVFAWGQGNSGSLGIGFASAKGSLMDEFGVFQGMEVNNLENVRKIISPTYSSIVCAIYSPQNNSETSMKCWGGGNNSGQLGIDSFGGTPVRDPTQVK